MDTKRLSFNEGDRVIHHYGIKGEFLQEAVVVRVRKTGRFRINRSENQFLPTGWEVAENGTWGQEWVEPWTPEGALKVVRHELEVRAIASANVLIQSIPDMDIDRLEFITSWIEHVNRKTKGE